MSDRIFGIWRIPKSGYNNGCLRGYDYPNVATMGYMNIGIAHLLKDDTVQAIAWLKEAAIKWPTLLGCHIIQASIHGNIGETVRASKEKGKVLSLSPFFNLKFYGQAYRDPDHRNNIVSGLRKAGLT